MHLAKQSVLCYGNLKKPLKLNLRKSESSGHPGSNQKGDLISLVAIIVPHPVSQIILIACSNHIEQSIVCEIVQGFAFWVQRVKNKSELSLGFLWDSPQFFR